MSEEKKAPYVLDAQTGDYILTLGSVKFFTDLPADNPVFSLVGQVCAEWAKLEHTLDLIIFEMIGGDRFPMSTLTAQIMGARPRLTAIVTLMTHRKYEIELISKANKLQDRCSKSQEQRNRIVHDPWFLEADSAGHLGASQHTSPRNKSSGLGYVSKSESELRQVLQEIKALRISAAELFVEAFNAENRRRNAPDHLPEDPQLG